MKKAAYTRFDKTILLTKLENKSVRFLIMWINKEMEIKLKSLDELRTGAVYCQLLHKMFPHAIQLSKIYFDSEVVRECEANFKLMEKSLEKLLDSKEISGCINISTSELLLGRGHLEFVRWFYTFYQDHINHIEVTNYEAAELRRQASRKSLKKIPTSLALIKATTNPKEECEVVPTDAKSYLDINEFCKECRNVPLPPSDSSDSESDYKKRTIPYNKRESVHRIINRHVRRTTYRLAAIKAFTMNGSRLQDPRLDACVQLSEAKIKFKQLHGIAIRHTTDLIRTIYQLCESMYL